jgi:hypothetical protein
MLSPNVREQYRNKGPSSQEETTGKTGNGCYIMWLKVNIVNVLTLNINCWRKRIMPKLNKNSDS